jgi:Tol biopolymer transport system component
MLRRGPVVPQQIVFMKPSGGAIVPGPGAFYEIAVMNLDGSGFRQLTSDGTFKFLPHFSPDASKIVYTKFLVGQYGVPNSITDIAVYNLVTNTETVITHQGVDVQGTWAPTGKRIAYLNIGPPTTMWTIDPDRRAIPWGRPRCNSVRREG